MIQKRIVQINLNNSKGAQDLLTQYMRENRIDMALISEPNAIPRGNWLGVSSGVAAIHWGRDESCALVERGRGYVAIESGGVILVSTYCSPNVGRATFEKLLEDIGNNIVSKYRGKKILIGRDLNARSRK